jgi:hypothetical protein
MSSLVRCSWTAALSIWALACSDITGINMEYTPITPEATELDAWLMAGGLSIVNLSEGNATASAGGVLAVTLELADPSISITEDARVPVSVRSASGDVETVLLRRKICEYSAEAWVVCGEVAIGTEAGALETLAAHLREFRAFMLGDYFGGTSVTAYFPYGTMGDILETVEGWQEVRWVEPNEVAFTTGSQGQSIRDQLKATPTVIGYMAIEDVAVAVGNDFLETVAQDELRVEYAPPLSSTLTKVVVVQEP